jgi:hypothetical protein
MVLNKIEHLLEKYDNGETTLKEEQQLRAYFAQNDVAPHLESYRVMFQYFANTKQEQFTKDVPLQTKKYTLYKWISVAAVAVLMMTAYFQMNQKNTLADLNHDELMAYNETVRALNLVSSKLNQGATSLSVLDFASNQFEKGEEQFNQMSEFSKTTNKIFKNK